MTSLSPSSQDYLEAILELSNKENEIRSIDIAQLMGVSRASVNKAVGILKDFGYITQQKYSYIELTDYGRKAASSIRERHDTLKTFLIEVLDVSEKTAEEDACKMEHAISSETFGKLKKYVKNTATAKK
jgi:Mn-dependent DtxR family transcriptional regulator